VNPRCRCGGTRTLVATAEDPVTHVTTAFFRCDRCGDERTQRTTRRPDR
jgi:hypothetical protein